MTPYRFSSTAPQPQFRATPDDGFLEGLLLEFDENPVLTRPMVSTHRDGDGQNGTNYIDIQAQVSADGRNEMAVAMVLDAAEYEWRAGLARAGCRNNTMRSAIAVLDHHQ